MDEKINQTPKNNLGKIGSDGGVFIDTRFNDSSLLSNEQGSLPNGSLLDATNDPDSSSLEAQRNVVSGGGSPNYNPSYYNKKSKRKFIIIAVLIFLLLSLLGFFVFETLLKRDEEAARNRDREPIKISNEELASIGSEIGINNSTVSINGPLRVNSNLVVAPSSVPQDAAAGELFFDQQSRHFMYYDGQNFQTIVSETMLTELSRSNVGLGLALNGGLLSNNGVLSLQGQTGDIVFNAGNGVSVDGTTIANTGVLSLQGSSGNVNLTAGPGITLNGLQITNAGVTALSGTANQVSVSSSSGSVVIRLPQDIAPSSSPSFAGITLANALGIGSGGTGNNTYNNNGVIYYDGTKFVSTGTPAAGLCLISNGSGVPVFGPCSGSATVTSVNGLTGAVSIVAGSGVSINEVDGEIEISAPAAAGVTSVNNLDGALTVANASAVGSTITINDASTSSKGIAQFDADDFSVTTGTVSLSNTVTTQGNTFNTANRLVQLNGDGYLPALNGSLLTDLDADSITAGTLSVAHGGTGATTFTQYGVLYGNGTGALQATAAGAEGQCLLVGADSIPYFGTCTGAGGVSSVNGKSSAVTIQGGTAIAVDNTGANIIINNTGVTSLQGTANQIIASASTGGITLSLPQDIGLTSNVIFNQATLGVVGSSAGRLVLNGGLSNSVTLLAPESPSAGLTFTLPSTAGTANQCLRTDGNGQLSFDDCVGGGSGGGITGSGTTNRLAKFSGGQAITDSNISDDGTTVTVQGSGGLLVGTASVAGNIAISDGSGNKISLVAPSIGSDITFTLPSTAGSANQCIKTDGTGVLTFDDCLGGGSGSGVSSITGSEPGSVGADGGVTINDASSTGNTITINTASNSVKGIASFSSTFFDVDGSGQVSVRNNSITLGTQTNGNYVASITAGSGLQGGGTGTPSLSLGPLTANWNQSGAFDIVLANANSNIQMMGNDGVFYGTIDVDNLTANRTYLFPDDDGEVCLNSGNCIGSGGGINSTGSDGFIAMFDGNGYTIADSIMSQAGNVISVSGTLTATSLQGDGSGITDLDAGEINAGTVGVAYGGTGVDASGATNGQLLIGNGSGFTLATLSGGDGITIVNSAGGITISAPDSGTCSSCAQGDDVVNSIQGTADGSSAVLGALTFNNAYTSGTEVTINDATTAEKGIASFNSTFFDVTSGAVSIKDNGIALGTKTTGDYVASVGVGNGLTVTGSGESAAVSLGLSLQADKGLVVDSNGLGLMTCTNEQILKYNQDDSKWECATDGEGLPSNLQGSYEAYGTDPAIINLNATNGGIRVRDSGTPLGVPLFAVQSSDGLTNYLSVDATGVSVGGTLNVSNSVTLGTLNNPTSITAADELEIASSNSKALILQTNTVGGLFFKDIDDTCMTGSGLTNPRLTVDQTTGRVTCVEDSEGEGIASITSNDGSLTIDDTDPENPDISVNLNANGGLANYGSSAGIGLLNTCTDNQILKFTQGTTTWGCADDEGFNDIAELDSGTKSANGASFDGNNLILQTADATYAGLVSIDAQTFAGDKTFNGSLTIDSDSNFTQTGTGTFSTGTGTVSLNGNTSIANDMSFTANGTALFKSNTDSLTALQVQNASGEELLTADTINQRITIGNDYTSNAKLTVSGDSTGGSSWIARTAEANSWRSITYGNGIFVAVSENGSNRVMTSTDGVTWTPRTAAQQNSWFSVTYGNGLFVAVSIDGSNRVMTSPNGITWTSRSAAAANNWTSVTYGNGLFVAVSGNSSNAVMTSPDGITWTGRTAAEANSWVDVTYGNGLFVAVAELGSGTRLMTSPDGITWTARTSANPAVWWESVTYGNGLFVAVGMNDTNNIMTSPDGITWTIRSHPAGSWTSVAYGGSKYVALSQSGANSVITSLDGISWNTEPSIQSGWWSVAYGNGTFAAVSRSGDDQVMTSSGATNPYGKAMDVRGDVDIFGSIITSGNIQGSIINATDAIHTAGVSRITSTGVLQNVSMTPNGTVKVGTTGGILYTDGSGVLQSLSLVGQNNKCVGLDALGVVGFQDCSGSGGGTTGWEWGGNNFTGNNGKSAYIRLTGDSYNTVIANPSIGLTNNTDLDILTNNTSRIRITASGAVQILSSTANSTEQFVVRNLSTGNPATTAYALRVDTSSDNLGRVGVGLLTGNAPQVRLDIGGNSTSTGRTTGGGIQIWASGNPGVSIGDGTTGEGKVASGRIYFDDATGKFRVSENGGDWVNLIQTAGSTPILIDGNNGFNGSGGGGIVTLGNRNANSSHTGTYGLLIGNAQNNNNITSGFRIDYNGNYVFNKPFIDNDQYGFKVEGNGTGANGVMHIDTRYNVVAIGNISTNSTASYGKLIVEGGIMSTGGFRVGTGSEDVGINRDCSSNSALTLNGVKFVGGILVKANASCSNNNSDLAEAYNNHDGAEPGELVMMSTSAATTVERATQSNNYRLAGIISTAPAQTIGTEQVPNGKPVALVGRVPTKVNLEGGAINVGDKITISSVAGIGKKATGRGMVVGTAMESFSGPGQGTIEVFVNTSYYDPTDGNFMQAEAGMFGDLNVSGMTTLTNLTVTGNAVFQGNITVNGHIISGGATPTVANSQAGVTTTVEGTDTAGTITITVTTPTAAGMVSTIQFSEQFDQAPRVSLTPDNAAASMVRYYTTNRTQTGFEVAANEIMPAGVYTFNYQVIQ